MKNPNSEYSDSFESAKQAYDRDGYVIFRGVIPRDEALELGAELKQLIEARDVDVQWQGKFISDEERAKSKILDMHEVHDVSDNFEALRHDPRILGRLAVLLGGPVIHHHNKGFVKPGVKGEIYGGKFPPHQDYPFFPHENYNMLAAIIYMSDITDDMGPVKVLPGSHHGGPRPTVEGTMHLRDDEFPLDQAVTATGRAGDMIAFNLNTLHMSGPNKSLVDRLSWLIQVKHPDAKNLTDAREPNEGEQLWPPVEH